MVYSNSLAQFENDISVAKFCGLRQSPEAIAKTTARSKIW